MEGIQRQPGRDDARKRAEAVLAMVRRGTKDHYGAAAALKAALEALLAALDAGPAAPGVREAFVAGAAWHEYDEHGATIWTSDRRRAEEEAERRYPNAEWIESARLSAVEAEVARLTAILSAQPAPEPAPPAGAAVREAETPGTTRVEGHDEQATDTGRTEDEAKQRNVAGDEAPGQIPELLGVQPTDGAQADPSTGGVPNSVQILRSRAADGTVAPAGAEVREAVSENDVYTLIGHAEYLRKVRGEEDMPKFFDGLARRLLAALRGGQKGGE